MGQLWGRVRGLNGGGLGEASSVSSSVRVGERSSFATHRDGLFRDRPEPRARRAQAQCRPARVDAARADIALRCEAAPRSCACLAWPCVELPQPSAHRAHKCTCRRRLCGLAVHDKLPPWRHRLCSHPASPARRRSASHIACQLVRRLPEHQLARQRVRVSATSRSGCDPGRPADRLVSRRWTAMRLGASHGRRASCVHIGQCMPSYRPTCCCGPRWSQSEVTVPSTSPGGVDVFVCQR